MIDVTPGVVLLLVLVLTVTLLQFRMEKKFSAD